MNRITTDQLLDALNILEETVYVTIPVKIEIHYPTLCRQVLEIVYTANQKLKLGELNTPSIDIRLQVNGGTWRLWSGDPAKDYSCRGVWSAVTVPITLEEEVIVQAVKRLVEGLIG